MAVHPDLTAFRAVDACGGAYTQEQHATKYAQGHMDALEAACKAVAKPDALMAELLEAARAAEFLLAALCVERSTETRVMLRAAIALAEGQS